MRLKKKALILALAFAMVFTFSIAFVNVTGDVFAANKKTCNILFIGDSTSAGFACSGFDDSNWGYSKAIPTKNAYTKQMANLIKNSGQFDSVNVSYYLLYGIRANELRALLQKDYYERALEEEKQVYTDAYKNESKGYLTQHINEYKNVVSGGDYDKFQEKIKGEIEKADYIFLDVGMSTMGTSLFEQSFNTSSNYLKESNIDMDAELKASTAKIKSSVNNRFVLLDTIGFGNYLRAASRGIGYCFADGLNNLDKSVENIKKLNPDCKIYVMGIFIPIKDVVLKGIPILGDISIKDELTKIYNEFNDYAANKTNTANEYTYVTYPNGVQTFGTALAEGAVKVSYKNGKCNFSGNEDAINALTIMIQGNPQKERAYFYKQHPTVKKTEKNKAKIAKLMIAATKKDSVSLRGIGELQNGINKKLEEYLNSNKEPEEIFTNNELISFNLTVQVGLYQACGSHPSAKGYKQKYNALSQAFIKDYVTDNIIDVKKATLLLKKGKTVTAANNVKYFVGDKVTKVTSNNKKIAKIVNKTRIKAVKKGTAKITVTFRSGLIKDYSVKVK